MITSQGPSNISMTSAPSRDQEENFYPVLLGIYAVVLVCGVLGVVLTVRVLQSNIRSLTTIGMFNLIFAHLLFLVTLPFRLHYYAVGKWHLGAGWCKAVSSMIHIHLYMSFVCYVVILVTRLLAFHKGAEQVEFRYRTPAFLGSLAVWSLVAVVVPCIVHYCYGATGGRPDTSPDTSKCFEFGQHIASSTLAVVFNYAVSVAIIAVALLLSGLQARVLLLLYREYGRDCDGHQVFGAQVKSMCFAGIMVVCFVPYHMYRLYYIGHLDAQHINEVFLSITALSCLDMLTFVKRGSCPMCSCPAC